MKRPPTASQPRRPVLYQICRAADEFEVGDGPFDLTSLDRLVLGRGAEGGYDTGADEDIVRVPDPWMSGRHALLIRDGAGFMVEDQGSTNGVLVNGKRVDRVALDNGDLVETGRTFWVYCVLPLEPAPPIEPAVFGPMSTWSPGFAAQLDNLRQASRSASPVLLLGEPGVGKQYAARAVHDASGRSGRLLEMDASRLVASHLAPELFGAHDPRAGAVGLSSGGTLFLSRVEAVPLDLQDRLLNVLETGKVAALAGKTMGVDMRLVCGAEVSDVDLAVQKGILSRRLVDRMRGAVLKIPPLRQRREDLGLIMQSLLERAEGARTITRDACRAILNYQWPRNTRELSKVIEGGAILALDDGAVDLRHLPGVIAMRANVSVDSEGGVTNEVPRHQVASAVMPFHGEPTGDESDDFPEHIQTDLDQVLSTRQMPAVGSLPPVRASTRQGAPPPPAPPPPPPPPPRVSSKRIPGPPPKPSRSRRG